MNINMNDENTPPDKSYESRDDKRVKSILNLLEIEKRMKDANCLLKATVEALQRDQLSMKERKEHASIIQEKVMPILELTRRYISDNAKVLSPMGGLGIVHNAEEAERKRKIRLVT